MAGDMVKGCAMWLVRDMVKQIGLYQPVTGQNRPKPLDDRPFS